MRVLIVYASRYGQTRKIAERLAHATGLRGAETHLFAIDDLPMNIQPHMADVVVLAGGVYFGKFSKKLERFASEQRANLAKIRSVFVAVSNAAKSTPGRVTAEADARAFAAKTGWVPDQIELVAGGEAYSQYGLFTRWLMLYYARKFGNRIDPSRDYDYTDWPAVDRLGHQLIGVEVHDPVLALM